MHKNADPTKVVLTDEEVAHNQPNHTIHHWCPKKIVTLHANADGVRCLTVLFALLVELLLKTTVEQRQR